MLVTINLITVFNSLSVCSLGELRAEFRVEILRAFLYKASNYNKLSRLSYPVIYKAIFTYFHEQTTSRNAYALNEKMKMRIYGNT